MSLDLFSVWDPPIFLSDANDVGSKLVVDLWRSTEHGLLSGLVPRNKALIDLSPCAIEFSSKAMLVLDPVEKQY